MPLWAILGSQIAIALLTAVVGAVSIAVASALIYDTELLPADGVVFIPAFFLAASSFAALGVLLGSVLPTSRSAQGAGIMIFFVMFLLSGCGPPRDVLTGPMLALGNALPLTWVITSLQDPWLGFGWATGPSLVVVGILVASVALSAHFFRWE